MAIKKCKECGEEISSSAKVCPKCGKDQRNFFQKHIILTIILVLILLGIIGGAMGGNDNSTSNAPYSSTSSQKKEDTVYNVGDLVSTKNCEITIENVGTAKRVGSTYVNSEPAEGGIYVTVDWKYKNISSEPLTTWNFPSIKLVDGNGTSYSADISASSYYATEKDPNRKVLSDLNPGISVTDNDVFEISEESYNSGEWFVVIDNNIKVKIK